MKGYSRTLLFGLFVAGLCLISCRQGDPQNENPPVSLTESSQNSLPATATNPVSSACKKIAFVMTSKSIPDIYTVCPDGSELINLTNDPSFDSHPSWSPDGTKIAFASSRAGNSQIYIMDADGNNPIKKTSDYENDFPIWLPDGKQIAFRTTDAKGLWWWRIVNIESNEISHFSEPSFDFFFQTPAWSPDGQSIAYMSLVEQQERNDGSSQIHIKNVDGTNDTPLTNNVWANINPVWSPDGKRIAFLSEQDGTYNVFALYMMDKSGENYQKLTEPIFPENVHFAWSPDGQQIAINNEFPVGNISIIDLRTGSSRVLLRLAEGESASAPSWQP